MTDAVFEVKRSDAAGRIGRLTLRDGERTVETPAILPVVNPHIQQISPRRLADEFGAEILITNAYVLYGSEDLRSRAIEEGLHELLGFPGAIMTDSGSFQLAEYGDIDVDTSDILQFQRRIGTDIATPVDVPTDPDADRERAVADVEATTEAIRTASAFDADGMLLSAPVQGATFPDLRERAARRAAEQDLDVYPIGGVVPLLREYRFDDVTRVIEGAKRGLPHDAPVHLFGAGHPMMFALAVALGCDLFDSAAYALYAREGRYLTVGGTLDLSDLSHLPCHCPVCATASPDELSDRTPEDRERLLAEHNLHVTFAEIRRIKQAIASGELLELVERRVRAHPRLLDGYRAALDVSGERLRTSDPASGQRPMFYCSSESAARPEVKRHHRRLDRLPIPDHLLLVDRATHPPGHVDTDEVVQWALAPPFGPIPPELANTYPLTAELPLERDGAAIEAAVDGVRALPLERADTITLVHAGWPATALERLPADVRPVAGEAVA